MPLRIDAVPAEATYDLRRRWLYESRPDTTVSPSEDAVVGTFHLGASDDTGAVVGIVSLTPAATPHRPRVVAWRLRGMTVDRAVQRQGVGTALLDEAVARLRALGAEVVWAEARDTALDFYRRHGWQVVGDGFVAGQLRRPHHLVLLDLR